ncbi:MAG: DUF3365 domain-containing protein [Fidelibacterota bacterium]
MQRQEDKFRRILLSITIFIIVLALFTTGHLIVLKNVTDVEFMLDIANRFYQYKLNEMTFPEDIRQQKYGDVENLIPGYSFKIISRNPVNPDHIPDSWESQQLQIMEDDPTKPFVFHKGGGGNDAGSSLLMPLRFEENCLRCHGRIDPETGQLQPESRYFPGDFAGAVRITTNNEGLQVKSYFLPVSLSFLAAILVLLVMVGFFIGWNSGYFILFRNKIRIKKK